MNGLTFAGGPVLAIIALSLVAALVVFLLRLLEMRRAHVMWEDFFGGVRNNLQQGREDEALALCENDASPAAKIAAVGIAHRNASEDVRRDAVETAARAAASRMLRRLSPIALVAQTAPLLGLFGTVTGFIRTVIALDTSELVARTDVMEGLMQSLVPAAAGLFTAIVAQVAYSILDGKLGRLLDEFELAKSETLAALSALRGEETVS